MRTSNHLAPLLIAAAAGCQAPVPRATPPTTHTVESFDGLPLVYDVRGQRDGRPALVFVHGWSCNRGFWSDQAERFAAEHLTVTLDLGGHGESGTSRDTWRLEDMAGDVVAVVDALQLEDLILVGHSMGGPVALLTAERLGERVRGVVAVEALHDPDLSFDPEAMAPFLELMDEDYDRFWEVNVQSALPPDTDPAIVERILEAARATPVAVARGLMLSFADYSASEVLARCEVPVRCVNGSLNPTRMEASRELHPDFDAVVLPGVGHFPMFEVPGELHAALARIVDELEGP